MKKAFTFDEWFRFTLAVCRVRDEIDHELGELMIRAGCDDSLWPAVHDRANVIGQHALADSVRALAIAEDRIGTASE